jgi:hypothetical protein
MVTQAGRVLAHGLYQLATAKRTPPHQRVPWQFKPGKLSGACVAANFCRRGRAQSDSRLSGVVAICGYS